VLCSSNFVCRKAFSLGVLKFEKVVDGMEQKAEAVPGKSSSAEVTSGVIQLVWCRLQNFEKCS
jgi:hypothetical protein